MNNNPVNSHLVQIKYVFVYQDNFWKQNKIEIEYEEKVKDMKKQCELEWGNFDKLVKLEYSEIQGLFHYTDIDNNYNWNHYNANKEWKPLDFFVKVSIAQDFTRKIWNNIVKSKTYPTYESVLKVYKKYLETNKITSNLLERKNKKEKVKPEIKTKKEKVKKIMTYIIKDKALLNTYKIGKSNNPLKREKTLQAEKPSLELVKIFKSNIENKLHKEYDKYRVRGEWFNLSKSQLKYICTTYK
tara:strand:+ start:130 stop:855 length:726 start_codon:yes stop_codon:yes gene_type:complete